MVLEREGGREGGIKRERKGVKNNLVDFVRAKPERGEEDRR